MSDRLAFPDWLGEVAPYTRIAYAPHLQKVVEQAAQAASAPGALAYRDEPGTTGLVARLHGDTWSVVFRICGDQDIPIFVLTDEVPGFAWRVDADEDWTVEIFAMVNAVFDVIEHDRFG